MTRIKLISVIILVAILTSIPVSMAHAAAGAGTILGITFDTDPVTGTTTVLVTLLDDTGVAQKARISLETAITLGLVIPNDLMIGQTVVVPDPIDPTIMLSGVVNTLAFVTDPLTGVTTLTVTLTDALSVVQVVNLDLAGALLLDLITTNPAMINTPVVIDPPDILDSETYSEKVTKLAAYFGNTLGLTYDLLAAYEEAGIGYGVLAQACWMATQLRGDSALLDQILAAKTSGDYSTLILPDGTSPTNWGQLRKAALTDPHQNLGRVVSGHADPLATPTAPTTTTTTTTTGPDETHGKGNGNNKDHGKSDKNK